MLNKTTYNHLEKCYIRGISGSFQWSSEHYHNDNTFTLNEFIEHYLEDNIEVYLKDMSYAEVIVNGVKYSLEAKGNGSSYDHIVEWDKIH